MLQRLFIIVFSFSLWFQCRPKPEEWLQKAKKSLDLENSQQALRFYQKAYEESLSDDFFVADRDDVFTHIDISANKHWILLVKISKDDDKTLQSSLVLINLENNDDYEAVIPQRIDQSMVSPDGKFALFKIRSPSVEVCKYILWQSAAEKFFNVDIKFDCAHKPAISDKGLIIYMRNGQIGAYDASQKSEIYPYLKQRPDKPNPRLPDNARFFFSAKNNAFFTYGAAGSYKLYTIENKILKVLSRSASHSRVFFLGDTEYPGLIIGGAGSRRFVFFDNITPGKIVHTLPVRRWADAAFMSGEAYYFIEEGRLKQYKNKKQSGLPFWAKGIHSGLQENLYFLSPLGTAINYKSILPEARSLAIFEKGWDLSESN